MNYNETINFLFSQLAMYQSQGPSAYKPGLDTTVALDTAFLSPSRRIKTIHVAGTNGKGSTSHSIAAVLQAAGYKTGLFTSPHLLDFRERIRINGQMIPKEKVTDFVNRYLSMNIDIHPSFFELTTIMAFDWFAQSDVDIAVIEVGLGGRLDSTNIITPILSVITNISPDHTAILGHTLEAIASEKAGIIKPDVPAIVGEAENSVRTVFENRAAEVGAPVIFATDNLPYSSFVIEPEHIVYENTPFGSLKCDLTGSYQPSNMATVLTSLAVLKNSCNIKLMASDVKKGLAAVTATTGLMGRWMQLSSDPSLICDTGHNIGGWEYIVPRLNDIPGHKEIIIGFVNDKDVSSVLKIASTIKDADFHFTQASVSRAMPVGDLVKMAQAHGITGDSHATVKEAYETVIKKAEPTSTIFVGGSTFIVADLLSVFSPT